MVTKNGIYLDLKESKYEAVKNGLIFYFSSENYLNKFLENVSEYIKEETIKIQNKYNIEGNFEKLLVISYYKKIEKRGFYIIDEKGQEVNKDIKIKCTIK